MRAYTKVIGLLSPASVVLWNFLTHWLARRPYDDATTMSQGKRQAPRGGRGQLGRQSINDASNFSLAIGPLTGMWFHLGKLRLILGFEPYGTFLRYIRQPFVYADFWACVLNFDWGIQWGIVVFLGARISE